MFKLKDLLLEANESVSDLIEELNSGSWIIPQKNGIDLYRGEPHSDKGFKIKPERKDRDPRDTSKFIHNLVDVIGRNAFEHLPLRSKSYFGATRLMGAEPYGAVHYAFPEKNSKVVSFQGDTMGYFKYANFAEVKKQYKRVKNYIPHDPQNDINEEENLVDMLNNNFKDGYGEVVEAYGMMAGRNWAGGIHSIFKDGFSLSEQVEMIEEMKKFFDSADPAEVKDLNGETGTLEEGMIRNLYLLCRSLHGSLYYILEYFEGAEKGITDDALEVMMGGKVLVAKKSFVDNNVEFNQSKNKWVRL